MTVQVEEPPVVSEDKRIEVLLSHYNTSFDSVLRVWSQRNRLFLWLLVLLTTETFFTFNPVAARAVVLGLFKKFTDADVKQLDETLDFGFVNLLGYAIWLYLTINLYQRSVYVSTYYGYLDRLERRMNALLGSDDVTREGEFYRRSRKPLHSNVGFFYTWIFHVLMGLVLAYKLVVDWPGEVAARPVVLYLLQWVFSSAILWYATQYLCWLLGKNNKG